MAAALIIIAAAILITAAFIPVKKATYKHSQKGFAVVELLTEVVALGCIKARFKRTISLPSIA